MESANVVVLGWAIMPTSDEFFALLRLLESASPRLSIALWFLLGALSGLAVAIYMGWIGW